VTEPAWVRSQRASLVDLDGGVVVMSSDGKLLRLDGESAELARVVIEYVALPRTHRQIVAHVESLAGALENTDVIDELLALLYDAAAIASPPVRARGNGVNVVVAVSGAIAATHAPALVAALQRLGHTIEIALTPTATRFVAIDALRAIVRREPHISPWPITPHAPVPHVALAHWADVVVVYPASATTIGRIATGDFSDVVSATVLTTRAPVIVVPSMNVDMFSSPAVQRNLDQLRRDGRAIVHGVPAEEAADAPAIRQPHSSAAPAPGEVARLVDALISAQVVHAPQRVRDWDAAYRKRSAEAGQLDPAATVDDDLARLLATHAPPPGRLLDVGTGLGAIARHAARAGYRVVATDISRVGIELASRCDRRDGDDIVWLVDDICASAVTGPFEVVVDRASLHVLTEQRVRAWAASIRAIATGVVIIKAHRHGTALTTGWSATAIANLLPEFEIIADEVGTLPHPTDQHTVSATVIALRRRLFDEV